MIAKYRALIIGLGSAGTAVMNEMKKDGRAEPVAFVETRKERIEQLKGAHPDAIIGTDYVRVLQTFRPDVVVAAGPDYLHGPQCLATLEAGCHVLIENPWQPAWKTLGSSWRLRSAPARSSWSTTQCGASLGHDDAGG